jgi:cysteine synthase A
MNSIPKHSIVDVIGDTPMIVLEDNLFAKAEYLNPGGSIKDRVAYSMIIGAELSGKLKPGQVIVAPTSGNTGIGLALVGTMRGYKVKIVMPENMSKERKKIIRMLGADLIFVDEDAGIEGSITKAEQICEEEKNHVLLQQFDDPNNSKVHYDTTGKEIWEQMNGKIGAFVAGVGSGGTLQGVGKYLKDRNSDIRLYPVEPQNHSAILGKEPGWHVIEGIGDGFIPDILDINMIHQVIEVKDEEALRTTRELVRDHGLLVGISSGANVFAARKVVQWLKYLHLPQRNVVTVLPDRVERYFSTSLMDE